MTHESNLSTALLGRYEIERQIGVGGMATVYLAMDVRHGRHVALKVLRPELAAVIGPARFLAEIRTTAALQHPHILPLHDSGEADGTVFYVMPFVDGETLRDRITREQQLPVDEAVRLAVQVASALDYAHRRNVIHRDIKPENILLQDGQALVADFGIALAVSRTEGATRMTETGLSLGTPRYMAPEQAMGEREITGKADVYALGCVLYEMLSGEPPFTGATAQAVIARAMTEEPRSLKMQRHTIPRNVDAAVSRALEKLPADRFASAGEFTAALQDAQYGRESRSSAETTVRDIDRRAKLVVPLAAVALIALAAAGWGLMRPGAAMPVSRFSLAFASDQMPLADQPFAISHDGSRFAYVGSADQVNGKLWLKDRNRADAVALPGTDAVVSFAFSPDAQSIAFVSPLGEVKTLPLGGGVGATLADSAGPQRGIAWLDDGNILFGGRLGRSIQIIPGNGGQAQPVWKSETANAIVVDALPGSAAALIAMCPGANCSGGADLVELDLHSHAVYPLIAGIQGARYVPTGHIVFVRGGALMAVPFSPRSHSLGSPIVNLQDRIAVGALGGALFDVSREGTLVTRTLGGDPRIRYEMVWVDRAGHEAPVDSAWTVHMTITGSNAGWSLSPDGTRLAMGLNTEAGDGIWIKHLPRGPLSRVSFDSAAEYRPRWIDNARLMFTSLRTSTSALYSRAADATGSDQLVFAAKSDINEGALSPDGKYLVLRTGGYSALHGERDIDIVRPGIDSVAKPLIATPFDEEAFALSPDGHWIAYESNETGQRTEIFIRPFPNVDSGKQQVSTDGGVAPLWSRDGRELFYVNGSRSMVVVPVSSGAAAKLGEPKVLFHMRDELYLSSPEYYTPFDIAPDGKHFIMARRVASGPSSPVSMVVAQNWFTELKARTKR